MRTQATVLSWSNVYRRTAAIWGIGLLLWGSHLAYAQAHATINGTVTDSSGAVIAGAEISIRSLQTGQVTRLTTMTEGNYSVPFLPVGAYDITASHSGFSTETRTGVGLTADQVATVSFMLKVGELTSAVEVKSEATEIDTTTGAIGQVINERAVVELPLNGRNPAELVYTVPGAAAANTINGLALPGAGSGFPLGETAASVNGSRMGGVFYQLDGVVHMNNYFNTANPFPNPDATQEFRVTTNNFDAQYGFTSGAVVSIATKSGTNEWHGALFEFLRNNNLNSADFFTHQADPLKRNQFGGSIGGPIKHNKLFVFGNFQQTIQHAALSASGSVVPNNQQLSGDFSQVPVQLVDPSTGKPYPNNQIPTSQFDPLSQKLLQYLPRTDDPGGNVITTGQVEVDDSREFTIKGDYYISNNNRLSVRYFFDDYKNPGYNGGGNLALATRAATARAHNYSFNDTWTISPNLVNALNVGFNKNKSGVQPTLVDSGGKPISPSLLGANIVSPPGTPPTIGLIAAGNTWITAIPVVQDRHNWVINDTISLNTGRHQIMAGVNILSQYSLENATWGADALMWFDGSVTGNAVADFLLGDLASFEQSGGEYNRLHGLQFASFAQDSIKLKPNLTVNVGVRWEPQVAPRYEQDKLAAFFPGHQSTRFTNAPVGLVYAGDPGVAKGGWNSDWPAIVPRISVAWQPKALPSTSIRAAIGMFILPYDYSFYNHMGPNAPFAPTYDINYTSVKPCIVKFADPWACFAPTGFKSPFPPFAGPNFHPPTDAAITTPVSVQAAFTPNFKPARSQSWNLSIEHEFNKDYLIRVAYIGRESYHLPVPMEQNPGIFAANGQRTIYPNFGSVLGYTSGGTQSYNALQISVDKHFSHGLQFSSNYTWSKNLDVSSVATLSNVGSISNPFSLGANRGYSDLSVPQIWNNTWVYQSPSLKNLGRVGDFLLGNWEVAGSWILHSGTPFTVMGSNGSNNSLAQIGQDHADYVSGQPLNQRQGSKNDWLNEYFNTAAFVTNAAGTFGTSGRNWLTSPGYNNVDAQFSKNFPFRERYRVQFRWEIFNLANRTFFSAPDSTVGDTNFGKITSDRNNNVDVHARLMQVALKLYF
ncbi:MAG: carboxypeptidase regulatory-like domain-containing protein [Acidobacteriia bacterium]|nr:carboxypeptidase regulatory-like domain-containing protein [Terriglobia bacterium]